MFTSRILLLLIPRSKLVTVNVAVATLLERLGSSVLVLLIAVVLFNVLPAAALTVAVKTICWFEISAASKDVVKTKLFGVLAVSTVGAPSAADVLTKPPKTVSTGKVSVMITS